MKNRSSRLLFSAGLFFCLIVISTCKKIEKSMLVATDEATNILTNSADLPGQIIDLGEGATQYGHYYGKASNTTADHTSLGTPNSLTGFTSQITGLEAGTKYYFKAYLTDGQETVYGKEKTFTTLAASSPSLTTTAVTSITLTGAVSGGNITSDGGAPVTGRGVCWNSFSGPTTSNNKTEDGTGTGTFISTLTGLTAGSTYFVRAYATNTVGTTYGNELTFTTTAASIPTVATSTISGISHNSALGGGNITSDGGSPVLEKGVCWSTATGPTISNTKTTNGAGTGSFASDISGLSPVTKYYVRAYATNIVGTAYGSEVSFTTSSAPVQLPVLTTVSPGNVTSVSATSGGDITSDGGASVNFRGVCWNTTGSPTADGLKTTDGSGTGSFASTITGLTPNTKYYVRAYAINSSGTGYGNEYNFTTLSASSAVITTTAITSIAQTTASGGGNITSDGGSAITVRGICWSLNQNPTLADSFTENGTGTGIYSSQLTNLSPGKTYYVRAYATNVTGTTYGNQVSFLTASDIPKVTTSAVGTVTSTTAAVGGEVLDNNGSTVTTRGICYNTIGSPTITDNVKSESAAIGVYSLSLTGLTPNTTYYIRAFATNAIGTAYGAQAQFVTPISSAVITTTAATSITTTTATSGGVISADGGSSITARGVCWSTSTNPVTGTATMTNDGTGVGTFTSALTGLLPNTKYYLRAYAINGFGTTYGDELTFTTTGSLPTLTTTAAYALASKTVSSGGNITSEGSTSVTSRGLCWSTSSNPTVANSKTTDGTGTGSFISSVSGLSANTTYYLRAYATNSNGTGYGNEVPITTTVQVSDNDGNTYNTVKVGTQLWMQENLKTTKYRDGTAINTFTDNASWGAQTTGAYCWYDNDMATYKDKYGALYNYYTGVDNRNLCPTGWHVPTDAEWTVFQNYLISNGYNYDGTTVDNKIAKAIGSTTSDWTSSTIAGAVGNTDYPSVRNKSGFTALPSLFRYATGFSGISGAGGVWWCSTESSLTLAIAHSIWNSEFSLFRGDADYKTSAFSVRCLQGEGLVLPAVTTTVISGITSGGATSGGNVTSNGNASVTARGVCWSTSTNPTTDLTTKTSDASGTGSFTSTLSGLSPVTTYYVRAYATNSVGTVYGNEVSFTTSAAAAVVPTISTTAISSVTSTTANSGGNITSNGGATITASGVCWSTTAAPVATGSHTTDGATTGTFVSSITGLTLGQTYYVRAYATNSAGTGYGNEISFTAALAIGDSYQGGIVAYILQSGDPGYVAGQTRGLIAAPSDQSTGTEWGCYGTTITGADGAVLGTGNQNTTDIVVGCATAGIAAKLCNDLVLGGYSDWYLPSKDELSKLYLNKSVIGGFANDWYFSSTEIDNNNVWYQYFSNGNQYFVNKSGSSYVRAIRAFPAAPVAPVVTTTAASAITATTATSGGNVLADGGADITARGVCWGLASGPTVSGNHTSDATGTGIFTSSLTGLTANKVYYIRAYATNSVGTVYGAELNFTTSADIPTVTTTTVSVIASTSVKSGGNVTSDGGSSILSQGVCWSTSADPTIAGTKTIDGSGTGIFTSSPTGLTPNTSYHLRAYATNAIGTAYGADITFSTTPLMTDGSGNTYNTIQIGPQLWMKENLKTTKYRDGTDIPNVTTDGTWASLLTGAYCEYNNTLSNVAVYGRLYNYYTTIDNKNLCPAGWHVPTDAEWTSLLTYVSDDGGKLKEKGTSHWNTPNAGATDESGFTGLPGGYRTNGGPYADIGNYGQFWTSTPNSATNGLYYTLQYLYANVPRYAYMKVGGFSVRCLQGEGQVLPAVTTTAVTGITSTTATSGGNVTSSGNASVTARGVCWSTSSGPTISDTHTTDGSGTGTFTSSLAGLTSGTTYYVRAYATNSVGTTYGVEEIFNTSGLAVGTVYQGGIIAYIFQSGDPGYVTGQTHGLIAAASDQSTGAVWGCSGTALTGADGTVLGTGNQNTIDIVTGCTTSGIAARICSDLSFGGYSDWYLPSKDELEKLYLNRTAIGGFTNNAYWSSSEDSSTNSWICYFYTGTIYVMGKTNAYHIRAIRSF